MGIPWETLLSSIRHYVRLQFFGVFLPGALSLLELSYLALPSSAGRPGPAAVVSAGSAPGPGRGPGRRTLTYRAGPSWMTARACSSKRWLASLRRKARASTMCPSSTEATT